MNRIWNLAVAGMMATVLAAPTLGIAQSVTSGQSTSTPRIDRRERNQQMRIRQGVRSGELNRREVRRLEGEQRRVRRHEAIAKSDGDVTARERHRLNRELDRSSRHIYRQKHDRQERRFR